MLHYYSSDIIECLYNTVLTYFTQTKQIHLWNGLVKQAHFTKHALISVVHLPWIRRSGPSEVFPTDFLLLNLKKWVSFTGCGLPLRQETLGEFEVPLDEVTFLLDSLPVKKRGDVVNDFKIIPFE